MATSSKATRRLPKPKPGHEITVQELKACDEFRDLTIAQRRFLIAYVMSNGSVKRASMLCAVAFMSHYFWNSNDEKYQKAFAKAREIYGDLLESRMQMDAMDGIPEPVFYKGEKVGNIRRFNAQERITLLKGYKNQYRDNFNLALVAGPQAMKVSLFGANGLINDGKLADPPKNLSQQKEDIETTATDTSDNDDK